MFYDKPKNTCFTQTDADRWRRTDRKSLGMLPVAYIKVLEGEAWVENPHSAKFLPFPQALEELEPHRKPLKGL